MLYTLSRSPIPCSHANRAAVCQLKYASLQFVQSQHRLRSRPVSSTAGVWMKSKSSWPALFPFSRTLKVAQHLPNCFRFSQKLPKPGDLKWNASPQGHLANLSQGQIMGITDSEYLPLRLLTLGNGAKRSQAFHTDFNIKYSDSLSTHVGGTSEVYYLSHSICEGSRQHQPSKWLLHDRNPQNPWIYMKHWFFIRLRQFMD